MRFLRRGQHSTREPHWWEILDDEWPPYPKTLVVFTVIVTLQISIIVVVWLLAYLITR